MIRTLVLFLAFISHAAAQTLCPGSAAAWSFGLPSPMQFAVYDLFSLPGVPAGMLTIAYANRTAETFIGVPQTVAQAFEFSSNQTQFFNNQVRPVYHELLLVQGSNCPLLTSTPGVMWTR